MYPSNPSLNIPLAYKRARRAKLIHYGHLIKILGVGQFDHLKRNKVKAFEWLLFLGRGEFKHPITEKFRCKGKIIKLKFHWYIKVA